MSKVILVCNEMSMSKFNFCVKLTLWFIQVTKNTSIFFTWLFSAMKACDLFKTASRTCWKQHVSKREQYHFHTNMMTEILSTWGHSPCVCVWVCRKDLVKWLLEPEGYLLAFVVCFGKSNTSGIPKRPFCSLVGYLHRYWGQWCMLQANTSALKSCVHYALRHLPLHLLIARSASQLQCGEKQQSSEQ